MSFRRTAVVTLIAMTNSFGQVDELPPLPEWSEEDMRRWEQGDELISDMLFQSQQDTEPVAPMIEGFSWQDYEREVAEEKKVRDIPADVLDAYFSRKPSSFLIDPQNILTRQEYRDRLSFLKYHDSDSRVGLYVYLFEGQQDLPSEMEVEQLFKEQFSDAGPTALVMYYMDEPGRAELHLSDELIRSVGQAERRRALQSAINQARSKSQPVDQLDSFCVQMSIRLYWMEKAWQAGIVAAPEMEAERVSIPNSVEWRQALASWWSQWSRYLLTGAFLSVFLSVSRWIQCRRRRYRFDDHPIRPRLGFPQAASASVVRRFSSHQSLSAESSERSNRR